MAEFGRGDVARDLGDPAAAVDIHRQALKRLLTCRPNQLAQAGLLRRMADGSLAADLG